MKSILDLSSTQARNFFLKEENYFNFDLPPYFQFDSLLKSISKQLDNKVLSDFYNSDNRPQDIEEVNYKLVTNKDGKYAWRPLQLIHPALYVYLVHTITEKDSWEYIKNRMTNLKKGSRNIVCSSLPVVSTYYKKSKAAQIVHWSSEVEKKSIINSLEYDYLFYTDITDCYGSLYTHSIAWALHNKKVAKKEKWNKTLIGNNIDFQIQTMSYGQTNGIPQGSVLMDFLAEIVLHYIDYLLADKIKNLKKSGYKIIRYRDDFRIFTNNPQVSENIIKELTNILNDFGMKINSAKTNGMNDVVHSSIKSDKLDWAVNHCDRSDLQSELLSISYFSKRFPNSGTVVKSLKLFYDKISTLSKKDVNGNIMVLISIIVDIAYKNPRTYPISSAILSKLFDYLPKSEKSKVVNKILNKFKKLPNTGIMQLWLQRITLKLDCKYLYTERLCRRVMDNTIVVWNSDWLDENLKTIINQHHLVNQDILKQMGPVIQNDEVELFELSEYLT